MKIVRVPLLDKTGPEEKVIGWAEVEVDDRGIPGKVIKTEIEDAELAKKIVGEFITNYHIDLKKPAHAEDKFHVRRVGIWPKRD